MPLLIETDHVRVRLNGAEEGIESVIPCCSSREDVQCLGEVQAPFVLP